MSDSNSNHKLPDVLKLYEDSYDIVEAPEFEPSDSEVLENREAIDRIRGINGHILLEDTNLIHQSQGFEEDKSRRKHRIVEDPDTPRIARSSIDVDYKFGDRGSNWRMMKLNRMLESARKYHKNIEQAALDRYGDLVLFYNAMEEKEELARRKRVDRKNWVYKPTGRLLNKHGLKVEQKVVKKPKTSVTEKELQEARINAMRSKIQRLPDYKEKETEYKRLKGIFDSTKKPSTISIDEDSMSINQLAKKEQMTSATTQLRESAKQIAKNRSFDNKNLDEQDNYASKLARLDTKDVKQLIDNPKLGRAIERCEYCLDSSRYPKPVIIKRSTSFYLTLMPQPEIVTGGCMIVSNEHIRNSLELDIDQRRELKDIMKELSIFYYKHKQGVIFYESSISDTGHFTLRAIPLPLSYTADTVKSYFVTAIMSYYDETESEHRPVIETSSSKPYETLIAKNAPFYHVWLTASGGIGHIVEEDQWPKGDLFTREVIGGMLGVNQFKIHSKLRLGSNKKLVKKLKEELGDDGDDDNNNTE